MENENKIEYMRRVRCNEDTQNVRAFRCFNIKHHVSTDNAVDILDEMLKAVELFPDLTDKLDDKVFELIAKAKVKQLERKIPEIIIEIVGTIEDEIIEEILSDEISEATSWLHEGFEFEEIKPIKVQILDRAEKNVTGLCRLTLCMDLDFAEIAFNLDFDKLLAFDDFNFVHDIIGIQNSINREKSTYATKPPNAVFDNCFVPRCARR